MAAKSHSRSHEFKSLRETWLTRNWRPAMAWQYFTVCLFDFIVGPIFHTVVQAEYHQTITQWNPLSLQGGGLYHLAMAAIIGVYSYGRTLERINLANKGIISGGPDMSGLRNTNVQMPGMNPYLIPDMPRQMPMPMPMPMPSAGVQTTTTTTAPAAPASAPVAPPIPPVAPPIPKP